MTDMKSTLMSLYCTAYRMRMRLRTRTKMSIHMAALDSNTPRRRAAGQSVGFPSRLLMEKQTWLM